MSEHLPMACSCGRSGDRVRPDFWKAIRWTVATMIWENEENLLARLDDENFVDGASLASWVIYSLDHDFEKSFSIKKVVSDQWMRVTIEEYGNPDNDISVEADRFEDALCALWAYVHENYKEAS